MTGGKLVAGTEHQLLFVFEVLVNGVAKFVKTCEMRVVGGKDGLAEDLFELFAAFGPLLLNFNHDFFGLLLEPNLARIY